MANRTLASDSGAGADANPLAGNWSSLSGRPAMKRVSGTFAGGTAGTNCASYWNAVSFPNDQWASVLMSGFVDGDCGVIVRCDAVDSYYSFYARSIANGGLIIEKMIAGATSTVIADPLSGGRLGDTIYFEAVGTQLLARINGTPVLVATDTSLASGHAGIAAYGAANPTTQWAAGDFADVASTRVERAFRRGRGGVN